MFIIEVVVERTVCSLMTPFHRHHHHQTFSKWPKLLTLLQGTLYWRGRISQFITEIEAVPFPPHS